MDGIRVTFQAVFTIIALLFECLLKALLYVLLVVFTILCCAVYPLVKDKLSWANPWAKYATKWGKGSYKLSGKVWRAWQA